MNATELLLDLSRLGIRLEAHGDRLRYFPRSALTPDILARLRAHKAELLALLRPVPDVAPDPARGGPERPSKAHNACLPVWLDNLAGCPDSRRAIGPAGLWPVRAFHRISRLAWKGYFTKGNVSDRIPTWPRNDPN